MIQYDKDGATLFYIDATGKKFSHNFMEGAAYNDMVVIRDAQIQAFRENTQARANYETALANAQISVDAGHTVVAPTKPTMKSVDDVGNVTFVPFEPPLADLKAPTLTPAPSGSIKVETPDIQMITYNMVKAIFRKLFPEA